MMLRSLLFVCSAVLTATASSSSAFAQEPVDFAMQVQPLLSKYCYACHGPDQQKSGLRLDVREDALKPADSDERAVIPGDAAGSRLMKVIDGRDPEFAMPPKGAKPTPQQVELIKRWINEGAKYNKHWSFIAPQRPAVPPVRNERFRDWPRNAIDHFILERLEREGLTPSPQADPYTLIRRVHMDLIGIPPTQEEVDAFVKEYVGWAPPTSPKVGDAPPTADPYEQLVDRLLASPHYGERWARRWLDLARYADTNGYEKDRTRSIWPYRDWVIKAINDDMPFDRFTIEQIAGDILAQKEIRNPKPETRNPELETYNALLTATGFHRNTMINEEGGIDVEEFRYHAVADRVATTSAVWLGLTVGCAQCHTHKYDPITHQEYFQIFAFLDNADEPEFELLTDDILRRREQITADIRRLENELESHFAPRAQVDLQWSVLSPAEMKTDSGRKLAVQEDRSIRAESGGAERDSYAFMLDVPPGQYDAVRLEVLPESTTPPTGPGLTPHGNFVLSELTIHRITGEGMKHQPIALKSADADIQQKNFPASAAIDGNLATGWAIDDGSGKLRQPHAATFQFDKPLTFDKGGKLSIRLDQQHGSHHLIGRLRLALGKRPEPVPVATAEDRRKLVDAELARWIAEHSPQARPWSTLRFSQMTGSKGGTFTIEPDGSILVSGDNPNQNVYTLSAPLAPQTITAIRLEVLPDESLPNGGPGRAPLFSEGDFHLGEFKVSLIAGEGKAEPVSLTFAAASHSFAQSGRSAGNAIDGDPDTAWSIKGGTGRPHQAVFQLKEPFRLDAAGRLVITLDQRYIHQMTIGRFRLSVTNDPRPAQASALPASIETILANNSANWSDDDRSALRRHFLLTTPVLRKQQQAIDQLRASMPRGHRTMIMQERDPQHARLTHLRKRGEFLQVAQPVKPGVLSVLHPLDTGSGQPTRLDFARWLVDPKNPLVGRVVMNRHWESFFGRGLVRTTEDLGLQGEKPSHPQLLDWLAVEFIEGTAPVNGDSAQSPRAPVRGWSMKHMHKLIVMSAAYRQSSDIPPQLLARDPENVLLARAPRVRLEAEMLRDSALASSGLLSRRIGGPSVFPPQPAGVTSLGYGGFNWPDATGDNRYRRGLYTFAKRTTPYAAFVTFDGPTGETCLVRRGRSNNPLQALTMMNDPVFVEASQALARRILAPQPQSGDTDDARLTRLFRSVLIRPPSADELATLKAFLAAQRDRMNKGELDAGKIAGDAPKTMDVRELAVWTVTARAVMNLDEAVTRN